MASKLNLAVNYLLRFFGFRLWRIFGEREILAKFSGKLHLSCAKNVPKSKFKNRSR